MKAKAALSAVGGLLACALASSGCETTAREEPVTSAVVEVGPPFEHVRLAPLIVYEGRAVYWYNNHWFFREGGRWGYYRTEPFALRPHRYFVRY
jgi:hypothetical protein